MLNPVTDLAETSMKKIEHIIAEPALKATCTTVKPIKNLEPLDGSSLGIIRTGKIKEKQIKSNTDLASKHSPKSDSTVIISKENKNLKSSTTSHEATIINLGDEKEQMPIVVESNSVIETPPVNLVGDYGSSSDTD